MDTQSSNTERLVAYLNAKADVDARAPTRLAEIIFGLITLFLFCAWLEASDVSQKVIEEKRSLAQRCEIYTKALTQVLNGKAIEVTDSTHVSCKARQL